MPCRAFARKNRVSSKLIAGIVVGIAGVLLISEAAEAVRRNQMPVGIEEEEEEAPQEEVKAEKPKPVKVKIPAPAPDSAPSTVWHSPATAPAAPADATTAPEGAAPVQGEVPAAATLTPEGTPVETVAANAPVVIDPATRLLQLTFEPGQVAAAEQQRLDLDGLVQKLQSETTLRITLNSFSSPREGQLNEARRISLKRAMDVRNYLIGKGIARERINVRALGDLVADEPKDRLDVTSL